MSSLPIEGVDYIVDLYAATQIARDADDETITATLRERIKEYHPDRLQGMAAEFRSKGERMSIIINQAKGILLDPEKRAHYDELLDSWDGLVSQSGQPVDSPERWQIRNLRSKTPEEIEASFEQDKVYIADRLNYSPSMLPMLTRLIEGNEGEVSEDVRNAYEDALLTYDRFLAIDEAHRGDLLGLPSLTGTGYAAIEGYAEAKEAEIEAARTTIREDAVLRAIGGVGTIREIESGSLKPVDPLSQDEVLKRVTEAALPDYFEDQAERLVAIAKEREEILEKRLDNFEPTYPLAEQQAVPQAAVLVVLDTGRSIKYAGLAYAVSTGSCESFAVKEDLLVALRAENYEALIASGYNVVTAKVPEQITTEGLLGAIAQKHWDRLSPDE